MGLVFVKKGGRAKRSEGASGKRVKTGGGTGKSGVSFRGHSGRRGSAHDWPHKGRRAFAVGLSSDRYQFRSVINILFIGDIVGRPGRDKIASWVGRLREKHALDFVIANAENAAAGAGITGSIAKTLLTQGIDVITLGDHVWDQRGWEHEIDEFPAVCRPAKLPEGCPGRDHVIVEKKGFRLAVFTVLGRTFLNMKSECPFRSADGMHARTVGSGKADAAFVEIHAEATSEKIALGWHLDGRALAVVGTHTHVPTADAEVRPKGTAYISDVGMTGPYESVLGRQVEPVVGRFLDGMPRRFGVAESDARLSGVKIAYDPATRRATTCELLVVK